MSLVITAVYTKPFISEINYDVLLIFFFFFWTATFWHSHWTVLTLPMSTFIHNSSVCQNMWHIFTTRDDGAIKHHSKTHQSGGGGGRLVVFRLNRSRLSGRIDEMCNLPHQIFMPLGLNFTRYSLECSVAFGNADHLDTSSSLPTSLLPLPLSHLLMSFQVPAKLVSGPDMPAWIVLPVPLFGHWKWSVCRAGISARITGQRQH